MHSMIVAAGLKVSLSSHLIGRFCIGHRNFVAAFGLMTGFTPAGRSKPPNAHFGSGFSTPRATAPIRQTPNDRTSLFILFISLFISFEIKTHRRRAPRATDAIIAPGKLALWGGTYNFRAHLTTAFVSASSTSFAPCRHDGRTESVQPGHDARCQTPPPELALHYASARRISHCRAVDARGTSQAS